VRGRVKKGVLGGGREDSALRGFAGTSAGPARRERVDDDAFSDPAFYIRCPDREAANASR
jgi:hypothetical protein